jgi:predicted MFS family arabinose efflux permease
MVTLVECARAMVGLMNTASQIGGLLGAVMYGYIVQHFGSYDTPFIPMAVVLFVGSLCWLRVDASQAFRAERGIAPVVVDA